MSEQKFYLGGNQIIHVRDDDWYEMGTWHQVATEVLELRAKNADLRKRLDEAEYININNEDCLRRQSEPGFFNAENMDYLKSGLDMTHRRIDQLADRIAMLERVRWGEEGEL